MNITSSLKLCATVATIGNRISVIYEAFSRCGPVVGFTAPLILQRGRLSPPYVVVCPYLFYLFIRKTSGAKRSFLAFLHFCPATGYGVLQAR